MAYWFAGYFARPMIPKPTTLPVNSSWREISEPFSGIGVFMADLRGKTPTIREVGTLARQLGILGATSWVYLTYTCGAGEIEHVYGMGANEQGPFGPIENGESSESPFQTFLVLMTRFGITEAECRNFLPFHRGYWQEKQFGPR